MTGSRPDRPLRVAVVNDYEIVVNGVARMLAEHPDRAHVVELDNRLPVVSDVDVVLFDAFAFVPDAGVDLADLVNADGAKVAVYTWSTHAEAIERAMALGAHGYLSKALSTDDLIDALEAIHRGETVISGPPLDATGAAGGGCWPGRDHGLSHRESEVLALIAQGLTNRQIAEALYLSINSVKTHIRSAYHRIQVDRRSQAVAWAMRHDFAPDAHRRVSWRRAGPGRPGSTGGSGATGQAAED